METLPDYITPGLDIVFVGLNPGLYSARVGHYFAAPTNRFWPAINRSGLLREPMDARTDYKMLEQGMGLTDVVKRPSGGMSDLRAEDYRQWATVLKGKLLSFQPLIVCFNGASAYRGYLRYTEGVNERPALGLQPRSIGRSKVFVVPSSSPRNATFSLDDLVRWYCQLRELRDRLKTT
jgi:TDG/mug DNA glycosylase family protein